MKSKTPPLYGTLITFEGTEGAGKSTLIALLEERLRQANVPVTRTREPGGSELAENIRAILLAQNMDSRTELFLYEAARCEHLARTVLPALARGDIVLCDRFTDSTFAYQGSARGLPWKEVETANRIATQGVKPKLTFWLDLEPAKGLARATVRTRFEDEGLEFQKRVRAGYTKLRKMEPRRFHVLRSDRLSPEAMCEEAWLILSRTLNRIQRTKKKSSRRERK